MGSQAGKTWFGAALILLALALAGAAFAEFEPHTKELSFPSESKLTGWDDERLVRKAGESDAAFAERTTRTVHRATYHCANTEVRFSVPALLVSLDRRIVDGEGFLDPRIARCGFCHQRAFILAEVWRRGGLKDAYVHGLRGHVVTVATIDGQTVVGDADLNTGPFALDLKGAGHDQRVEAVKAAYRSSNAAADTMVGVVAAYRDVSDDAPYGPVETLLTKADAQWQAHQFVRFGLMVVAIVIGGIGVLLLLRRQAATRTEA